LDDNKKPGQRDISDLKARLGLKKTAAMPAAAPPNTTPPRGQAIPAPMPNQGSGPTASPPVPSPFGQPAQPQPPSPWGREQAQPAPQPPPDPRRDPFAQQQAANLAAFYGLGQVLPGSSDSVNAEPLSKPKPWARIALVGGLGFVVFVVGTFFGGVHSSRVDFNDTIDQAGQIRDEIDHLGKQLGMIADTINQSKATLSGGIDLDMTAHLGELDLRKPDTTKIFHTNYEHLEDVAIERLFTYYDHTIRLYDLITEHAKKTANDKDAITRYVKNDAAKAEQKYGIVFDASHPLLVAQLVELGLPVCPKAGQTDCNAKDLKGFQFRMGSGGPWSQRTVKGKTTDTLVPIEPTPFFTSVVAGNPDLLAVKDYARRIAEIRSLAGSLVAEQKDVLADLKRAAERPKVFVF
jgi:hypothetical protein